jgi:asparagine synthase (glutamine-hydrolysing)
MPENAYNVRMCGFAGVLRWGGLAPGEAERLQAAGRTLAHRGPDSEGAWHDTHCALVFRRLKVIDLSPRGEQPMANENGALHVVFNGEIYNYKELRSGLGARGHIIRSYSDTEVLLHGYEEWGLEGLLQKLRGMFAFALYDAAARRLVLARDPCGQKPLYFAERKGLLLFASEPKALFATGLVKPELDPVALHEALTYRFVPAPRSGFKDVEKLPPGHCAEAENGALRYRRWWTPATTASASMKPDIPRVWRGVGTAVEALRPTLQRAVASIGSPTSRSARGSPAAWTRAS